MRRYKKTSVEQELSDEAVWEELYCDHVGRMLENDTAARQVFRDIEDKTTAQKIYLRLMDFIDNMLNKIGFGRSFYTDRRDALTKIFNEIYGVDKKAETERSSPILTDEDVKEEPTAEQPQRVYNGRPADIDDTFGKQPTPKAETEPTAPPAPTTEQQVRSIVDELYKGASEADKQSLIDDVMADPRDAEAKLADLKEMLANDGTNDTPSFSLTPEEELETDAERRLADPNASTFEKMAANAVLRAHALRGNGTPKFSVNPDKEVGNVVVDSSRDKLPMSRTEAITMLDSMTQPFHNNDQDVDIFVSHRDADHSMSYRNIDQIKVIGAYGDLIANAVKIGEAPVKEKVKDSVKAVHIYYCPINIDGKQYSARMVVREYYQGKYIVDELHLYNTQLRKEKTDAIHAQPQNGSPNVLTPVKSRYKISELIHSTQEEDLKLLGIGRDEPKFSLSRDDDRPTFYSNAAHAVEAVKQNKATAEQWKAMLTKAGGIKAGEDKWMGLSQWLDENKGKPLIKASMVEGYERVNGLLGNELGESSSPPHSSLLFHNSFNSAKEILP